MNSAQASTAIRKAADALDGIVQALHPSHKVRSTQSRILRDCAHRLSMTAIERALLAGVLKAVFNRLAELTADLTMDENRVDIASKLLQIMMQIDQALSSNAPEIYTPRVPVVVGGAE